MGVCEIMYNVIIEISRQREPTVIQVLQGIFTWDRQIMTLLRLNASYNISCFFQSSLVKIYISTPLTLNVSYQPSPHLVCPSSAARPSPPPPAS